MGSGRSRQVLWHMLRRWAQQPAAAGGLGAGTTTGDAACLLVWQRREKEQQRRSSIAYRASSWHHPTLCADDLCVIGSIRGG